MNFQQIFQTYLQEIYSFLEKYLAKKAYEAEKIAPETFYFVKAGNKFILKNGKDACPPHGVEIEPAVSYFFYKSFGGKEENKFLNIAAALSLSHHFYKIHEVTSWKVSGLKNPLLKNIFKKYQNDKKKKDPSHIAFSQGLVLGDIVSGFCYELVIDSKFSDEQKIRVLAELNEIIKWRQVMKLAEFKKELDKNLQINRKKYLFEGPARIGAYLADGQEVSREKIISLIKLFKKTAQIYEN
jgi:hypothetical protein